MTQNTKRIALLFLAASLVSVVLLSSSLSNLPLQAGMPFPGIDNSNGMSQPVADLAVEHTFSVTILKGVLDLILLILLISVPARLIPLVNMKMFLRVLLVVIVLLLIANLLSRIPGSQPVHVPGEPSGVPAITSEYPVSSLGQPPQGFIWLVVVAVVLGAGVLAIKLLRPSPVPTSVEDQLSQEAESAIHAIQVGENLHSVIIRCYLQMMRALQEEQKIERTEQMTVREFEAWLEAKGFPSVPVRQLSSLFEKVRYGRQEMREEDEMTAVASLNEILQFCRTQRGSAR